eukprot:COSAG01_NODE_11193_length_1985_cov_2.538176_1_plen_62_part_00
MIVLYVLYVLPPPPLSLSLAVCVCVRVCSRRSVGLIVGECAVARHLLPPTSGFYELFLLVA